MIYSTLPKKACVKREEEEEEEEREREREREFPIANVENNCTNSKSAGSQKTSYSKIKYNKQSKANLSELNHKYMQGSGS